MEFNIMPFLAEAFAMNERTYTFIDKIYNVDRLKFINAAKDSGLYNHDIIKEGSVQQEYYFKKSLGLLIVSAYDEEVRDGVIKICEKGWKYASTYIKSKDEIELSLFIKNFVKKNKGIDNISDDDFNGNITVLIFLAAFLEKEIVQDDPFYIDTIQSLMQRFTYYETKEKINLSLLGRNKKKKLQELELKIKKKFKIYPLSCGHNLNNKCLEDGLTLDLDKITEEDKAYAPFGYIFDSHDISLAAVVGNDFLNSKELQELIYYYATFYKNWDDIDEEKLYNYIYPAMQIRYLTKEYKKAKEYFFENFNEELYEEIRKADLEAKESKKSNLLLQDENERLKEEIKRLERENRRLNQQLEENKLNKNELIGLREYMFAKQEMETEQYNKEDIFVDYNKLSEYKCTIFGGHDNWQLKVKEKIKQWNYVSRKTLNFDTDLITNVDYIIINCMSHAMYYKIIENAKDQKIIYIKNNNIDICLRDIDENLD
ncbi:MULTISPECIES: hypothetical protein [unclassified Clostridium]|uniref:hypothetical protein n=1 Tax=unclassified Clostridium TaxID=2614128 RepID=UPI0025BD1C52|nr:MULTISPECIES: hypothetical protein [unclassified Clostridium]